jgi:hypothetical protein
MLCLHDSIRDDDPDRQRLLRTVEDAPALPALILAAWQVARVLAVHLVEAVLAERARRPTAWPPGPACGVAVQSKGFAPRQMMSLGGPIRWQRRGGRCSKGGVIPQVAPLDEALGVPPHQRTRDEVQSLGCAVAVFAPCATAARLLGWSSGGPVSPRAVWGWVHAAGQRAMAQLHTQLQARDQGHLPPEAPLAAALVAAPFLLGADGVMVPFRPAGGHPQGKTAWHEVTVGVVARVGQHRTRTGQVVARLHQRRLVAVCGALEALKARRWLAAVRQGMLHAPRVVWRKRAKLYLDCFVSNPVVERDPHWHSKSDTNMGSTRKWYRKSTELHNSGDSQRCARVEQAKHLCPWRQSGWCNLTEPH